MSTILGKSVRLGEFVFSSGVHCKKEQPGNVFIDNGCPGAIVLTFQVRGALEMSVECRKRQGPVSGPIVLPG